MFNFQDLPVFQGIYALHLSIAHPQTISIGRLGHYHFPAGDYVYVGSARGAGGLRARIGRHLRGNGARHCHIDYFRAVAEVREVFYTVTDKPLECVWNQVLSQLPQAFIPVPRFGSSDCRSGCAAHLIAFPRLTNLADVQRVLKQSAHTPIVCLYGT